MDLLGPLGPEPRKSPKRVRKESPRARRPRDPQSPKRARSRISTESEKSIKSDFWTLSGLFSDSSGARTAWTAQCVGGEDCKRVLQWALSGWTLRTFSTFFCSGTVAREEAFKQVARRGRHSHQAGTTNTRAKKKNNTQESTSRQIFLGIVTRDYECLGTVPAFFLRFLGTISKSCLCFI